MHKRTPLHAQTFLYANTYKITNTNTHAVTNARAQTDGQTTKQNDYNCPSDEGGIVIVEPAIDNSIQDYEDRPAAVHAPHVHPRV